MKLGIPLNSIVSLYLSVCVCVLDNSVEGRDVMKIFKSFNWWILIYPFTRLKSLKGNRKFNPWLLSIGCCIPDENRLVFYIRSNGLETSKFVDRFLKTITIDYSWTFGLTIDGEVYGTWNVNHDVYWTQMQV